MTTSFGEHLAERALLRRSGLHHRSTRQDRRRVHAGGGEHDAARRDDAGLADGRSAAAGPLPAEIDQAKLTAALDTAFADPEARTAGMVVVHKGRLIAERYMPGITKDTQLESWSMGKSITSTLFALLVKDGTYTLEQRAPVPEWQAPGDPRGAIRNIDLLRMSSGLRFIATQDPDYTPDKGYPDHFYIYTGAVNAFDYSVNVPLQFPVNTEGRYRNCDPLTIGLAGQAGRHQARRGIPDVAAARALRPHRHPPSGARDRSVRQFPAHRLRLRHAAQLGAARAALSAGRHVAGHAHAARRLGEVREHAGAGMEDAATTAGCSGSTAPANGTCRRTPISWRAPAASGPSSFRRNSSSSCGWATTTAPAPASARSIARSTCC